MRSVSINQTLALVICRALLAYAPSRVREQITAVVFPDAQRDPIRSERGLIRAQLAIVAVAADPGADARLS